MTPEVGEEAKSQAKPKTRDVTLKMDGGREERTTWALEILLTLYNLVLNYSY